MLKRIVDTIPAYAPLRTACQSATRPVVLLHYTAAPIVGGVEGIMSEQARVLLAHGVAVSVVAGRGAPQVLVPELDSRHPRVLAVQADLEAGRVPAAFAPLVETIRHSLATWLAGFDDPVVLVHNAFTLHKNLALTAALADLAATGTARFVAWCHDLAWTNPLYQAALHDGRPWDLLRQPLPGVTYVTISEMRRRELADLFGWQPSAIQCVPNGIDPARFLGSGPAMVQVAQRLDWTARDLVVLAPVRMTRRKNLELALATTAAIKAEGLRPLLVITGPPGPHNPQQDYVAELYRERQRLGLAAEVVFLSQVDWLPDGVSDELMADLYRWADALLFPSLQEGFGQPILEAGLARLPIFCTDLAVLAETGGADVQYFPADVEPAVLARQILGVLTGAGAPALRRRVVQNYSWEAIYQTGLLPLVRYPTFEL
ncbi:MAG: glycosyltransferase [Chloroflexota bacterium]|nr:glycosyltransferase [Chloroflexota bacterium]